MLKYIHPKRFFEFIRDLFRNRWLIWQLTKKDFKNKYLGSYLGIIWAFIQPAITIFILWFVFQVGFKAQPVTDVPFAVWLIVGMVPWFFISESLQNATNSIIEFSYLIKKVVFRASLLPVIKVFSSLFVNLFFIGILFIILVVYGLYPNLYALQILYYLFASIMFVLSISWITSSLIVFIRDIGQIIGVVIQLGFWATPIFWTIEMIPEKLHIVFKLNPFYYLTEGYRDALINRIWFWERPYQTLYFWGLTLVLWIIGTVMFKKLRPHFADVL